MHTAVGQDRDCALVVRLFGVAVKPLMQSWGNRQCDANDEAENQSDLDGALSHRGRRFRFNAALRKFFSALGFRGSNER